MLRQGLRKEGELHLIMVVIEMRPGKEVANCGMSYPNTHILRSSIMFPKLFLPCDVSIILNKMAQWSLYSVLSFIALTSSLLDITAEPDFTSVLRLKYDLGNPNPLPSHPKNCRCCSGHRCQHSLPNLTSDLNKHVQLSTQQGLVYFLRMVLNT